jgi:hypothetical protein
LRREECAECGGARTTIEEKLAGLLNPFAGLVSGVQAIPAAYGRSWSHGAVLMPAPHAVLGATGSGANPGEARTRMVFEAVERFCSAWTPGVPEEVELAPLDTGEPLRAKASEIYFGYPGVKGDTTGCAAAPDKETAVRHGWLEVLERDAVARWWSEREAPRRERVTETAKAWALDIGRHEGVAVAAVLEEDEQGLHLGTGAAREWGEAVRNAEREMRQFQLWDRVTGAPPHRRKWREHYAKERGAWLRGAVSDGSKWPRQPPPAAYYADLTHAWLRIPVVRVAIPGARTIRELDLPL